MGGGPEAVQGGLKATFGPQEQIRLESAGGTVQGVHRRSGPARSGFLRKRLESACIRQSSTGSTNAGATAGPNLHSSHEKRIPPIGAKATLQEGSDRRSERPSPPGGLVGLLVEVLAWISPRLVGGMHVLKKPSTPPTPSAGAIAFGELACHGRVLLPQKGGHLGPGDAVAEANGGIFAGNLIFSHASTLRGPTRSGMRYPLFLRMRTAVISDIHGNLEALQVVLASIDQRGVDRIVCLGDVLGYGPNPVECVDLVAERCEWCLLGNHDLAALYEPTNFNEVAERAAYWTRKQLEAVTDADQRRPLGVAGEAPCSCSRRRLLGGPWHPRKPINEYLFPEDVQSGTRKFEQIFARVPRYGMQGHTHVPGVFTAEPEFYSPEELGEGPWTLPTDEQLIFNPGSVGQPRDGDPRASYAILETSEGEDKTTLEFIREPYDIEAVAAKIIAEPELADWLGERLREGR